MPRLVAFEPKLIFLSCGFDGVAGDPTEAETTLTPAWYGQVASACITHAPVVATLQGGYLAGAVAEAGQRVLAALAGVAPEVAPSRTHAYSTAVMELVEAVEAKLEDTDRWWSVEHSFNHGLADSEDDEEDGENENVHADEVAEA